MIGHRDGVEPAVLRALHKLEERHRAVALGRMCVELCADVADGHERGVATDLIKRSRLAELRFNRVNR